MPKRARIIVQQAPGSTQSAREVPAFQLAEKIAQSSSGGMIRYSR